MSRAGMGLLVAVAVASGRAGAGQQQEQQPAERRLPRDPSMPASATRRPVRLPAAIRAGDKVLPKGAYQVGIGRDAEGVWIELWQDGAVAVRELAVKPPRSARSARPPQPRRGVWVTLDQRQEKLVRVYCQEGSEVYLAVFERAS